MRTNPAPLSFLLAMSLVVLVACGGADGGASGGDAGPGDVCARASVLTCEDVDTCDEVYSTSSADQLTPLCDDPGESTSGFPCTLRQCCYRDDGLFGMPSLHCVSDSIDPNYEAYCLRQGGTYCER